MADYLGSDVEDEADESFDFNQRYGTRDALIFLIDSTAAMFETDSNGQLPFALALKCIHSTLRNKIISSERDFVACVFFGTDKHKNESDFEHLVVYQELTTPGAEQILAVESLIEDPESFQEECGHSEDFSLNDSLWLCQILLSRSSVRLSSQRILLFTNNDDPHHNAPQKKKQAKQRAEDLADVNVELDLIPIGRDFSFRKFYQEVLFLPEEDLLVDPSEKLEELLAQVRTKDHKKRSVGRIAFQLGDGLEMSVGIYNLVRRMNKPRKVKLDHRTNEELTTMTKLFNGETGEVLLPSDIHHYLEYANKKIAFTRDEMRGMKKMCAPGLQLLGFKPRHRIKPHHHVKPSSFIYPEEKLTKGSRNLFGALLSRCLDRDVVPICRLTARQDSAPELVALVPQADVEENGVQLVPAGFHVIYLPFVDDMRNLPFTLTTRASEDQIEAAKEIIKKLKFPYNPELFENPVLQTHWRNIEALALNRDSVEEVNDYTVPNMEKIKKKISTQVAEFKDLVFPAEYDPAVTGSKQKRTRNDASGPSSKKARGEPVDMNEQAKAKKVEKLTVDVLKQYLKEVGISVTGKKKAELVDDVYNYLGVIQP